MPTYHIHIKGIVQGVGFRPLVCQLAIAKQLTGWVCNDNDGVHIGINANEQEANDFYQSILKDPPRNSFIQQYAISLVDDIVFDDFRIISSQANTQPDLLLTPDIAICENCKTEIETAENRRHHYAFTTCLQCGPRYSIVNALPYDRERTTMAEYKMCDSCAAEYDDITNRRHYSQTNSCPDCAIPIHLYNARKEKITSDAELVIKLAKQYLGEGKILAVKGIGGYLLMCDATNAGPIKLLRERKQRPAKPFAVMYDNISEIEKDVFVSDVAKKALLSKEAPIVLCAMMNNESTLQKDLITCGLDKLGVFLPYTPLLKLITAAFKKPLIATSGNLSGSPIIYKDDEALQWLTSFADYIITFDRDIVTPQDDSVVQYSASGKRIILRRSRGLAPNYFPNPFKSSKPLLAMGAELKSAFALLDKNLYISQFLGDQESYESQESYKATLQHLQQLLKIVPAKILVDKHPNYNVSLLGKELAAQQNLPVAEVQHHVAHFCSVLAENKLLHTKEKILGVVWDGTGYGDDGQIWGGEFFTLHEANIERVAHLDYFPQLMGDKMSREPRLSALALCKGKPELVKNNFTEEEYSLFTKQLQSVQLQTSSMGRFLDGMASLLGILQHNSYEGEAAMKLEVAARSCIPKHFDSYDVFYNDGVLEWNGIIESAISDKNDNFEIAYIARKVFVSLVKMIELVAEHSGTNKIAFSGGVFQNAFLIDLVEEMLSGKYELLCHQQLTPNDECISFGQLAYWENLNHNGTEVSE